MINIATCGATGAGKSKFCKYLQENYGYTLISTGAIIREVSNIIFGNEDKINLNLLAASLTSINHSLVLEAALRRATLAKSERLAFDSVRSQADLEYLRSNDFSIVKIYAKPNNIDERLKLRQQTFNREIDGIDAIETFHESVTAEIEIENNGTEEEFFDKIRRLMQC